MCYNIDMNKFSWNSPGNGRGNMLWPLIIGAIIGGYIVHQVNRSKNANALGGERVDTGDCLPDDEDYIYNPQCLLADKTDDEKISQEAEEYAKAHKREIIKKYLDGIPKAKAPSTIFMAGAPGAGKTEVSKQLLSKHLHGFVQIDADELRAALPNYNGANAHLFQKAASTLVSELYSKALRAGVHIILDGTFSNFATQKQNIERSLKRNRDVAIMYVYQSPEAAWRFVQIRQKDDGGRSVPALEFVKKFIESHKVANEIKWHFKDKVTLHLMIKNDVGDNKGWLIDIDSLDEHIKKAYNEADLKKITGGN